MNRALTRSRRRLVGVALAAVALVGLGTASAAQLGVGSAVLAAGSAQVGDCQGTTPLRVQLVSGWDQGMNPDAYTTTGVTVHGVAAACVGQRIEVTLVGGDGAVLRTAVVPTIGAAGTQPTVTVAKLETAIIARAEILIHS